MDVKAALAELVRLMVDGRSSSEHTEASFTAIIEAAEEVMQLLQDRAVAPEDVFDGLSEETRRHLIAAYALDIRNKTQAFRAMCCDV